jgi:hypothetical protein
VQTFDVASPFELSSLVSHKAGSLGRKRVTCVALRAAIVGNSNCGALRGTVTRRKVALGVRGWSAVVKADNGHCSRRCLGCRRPYFLLGVKFRNHDGWAEAGKTTWLAAATITIPYPCMHDDPISYANIRKHVAFSRLRDQVSEKLSQTMHLRVWTSITLQPLRSRLQAL